MVWDEGVGVLFDDKIMFVGICVGFVVDKVLLLKVVGDVDVVICNSVKVVCVEYMMLLFVYVLFELMNFIVNFYDGKVDLIGLI